MSEAYTGVEGLRSLYMGRYTKRSRRAKESNNLKDYAGGKKGTAHGNCRHTTETMTRARALLAANWRLPSRGGWRMVLADMAEWLGLPYWTLYELSRNGHYRADAVPSEEYIDQFEKVLRDMHAAKGRLRRQKKLKVRDAKDRATEAADGASSMAEQTALSQALVPYERMLDLFRAQGKELPKTLSQAEALLIELVQSGDIKYADYQEMITAAQKQLPTNHSK